MEEAKLKQTLAPEDFHIGRADTSSNAWIVWRPQYTSEMAQTQNVHFPPSLKHRGLKLDGAIGQGEICNSLKRENF